MDNIHILWVSDNRDTAVNMITMYALNSKKNNWWKNVNVIIWGASAKLVAEDSQVQTEIFDMISQGIRIEACKACCDNLGVSEKLTGFGIDVKYMGKQLTDYIKSGDKILTI
jgi:hypothetical protein